MATGDFIGRETISLFLRKKDMSLKLCKSNMVTLKVVFSPRESGALCEACVQRNVTGVSSDVWHLSPGFLSVPFRFEPGDLNWAGRLPHPLEFAWGTWGMFYDSGLVVHGSSVRPFLMWLNTLFTTSLLLFKL